MAITDVDFAIRDDLLFLYSASIKLRIKIRDGVAVYQLLLDLESPFFR